jgi:DNA-binding FadR family transcriptional regulator
VAARNRFLAQMLRPASQALFVARLLSCQRPGLPGASLSEQEHEEILAAIEQGDQQQARTAMRKHIAGFEDNIHAVLSQGFSYTIAELTSELDGV